MELAAYIVLIGVVLTSMVTKTKTPEEDVAWRIIASGFFVFFGPGIVWIRALGFRYKSIYELICVAFVLSIVFHLALALSSFYFKTTISFWACKG
jgi:apolipoprotein N-acyltransferase